MKANMLNVLYENNIEYLDSYTIFPDAYCGSGEIRAIILGADPTSFKNGEIQRLKFVFDLNIQGKRDKRFFSSIERNLNLVGLSMDEIFVQNLCRNYFTEVTYDHRENWKEAGLLWTDHLNYELESKKIDKSIPVLVTSEIILEVLIKKNSILKAKEYYSNPGLIPISAEHSKLNRPLIPFYRSSSYFLNDQRWKNYRISLCQMFDKTGLLQLLLMQLTNALKNTYVTNTDTVIEQRYLIESINHLYFVIRLNDHNPPHFHVLSKDRNINASFRISDGALWKGKINNKDRSRIKYFFDNNKDKLIKYWNHYHPHQTIK